LTDDPALQPRFPTGTIDLRQLLEWGSEDYRAATRHSAMRRVKLPVLQSSARLVAANLGASLRGD
jgi:hypothetical protein